MKALRLDIDKALETAGAKHNVSLKLGSGSYQPSAGTASFKLEVVTMADTGEARDLRAEAFKSFAVLLGLQPEDLGKSIMLVGKPHMITGYNPKARKNSIRVRDVTNGKDYVTSVECVKKALEKQSKVA